ncbi:MAG: hypothetical protein Q8O55_07610 [Dehalococcoidales bacterium]|nr:hypothetical protein [Dehalococcoidales bacterium]
MAWQLIKEEFTSKSFTYQGPAEEAVISFSAGPEQLDFINNFFVNQLVAQSKQAVAGNAPGDELMYLSLYRDTSATWETKYELHLLATDITGNALPWLLIIGVALALIIYWLIVRPVVRQITALVWGTPTPGEGGDPAKKPWENPVLILALGSAALIGIAMFKGTSVKGAVTGNR